MKHLIYQYTFPNGKYYIGQCLGDSLEDLNSRAGKNGCKYRGQLVHNAILKYGWDNIEKTILAICNSQTEANRYEVFFINSFSSLVSQNGYNVDIGGKGHNLGKQSNTKEYRQKRYQENKEEQKRQAIQYIKEHPEKNRETARLYYWKHRDAILKKRRENSKSDLGAR